MQSKVSVLLCFVLASAAHAGAASSNVLEFAPEAQLFAPGHASTEFSDARLTISPDGRTALWFTRNRPGGAGGYDIWMMHRTKNGAGEQLPSQVNSQDTDTYAPMLDWSHPSRLTFSGQRSHAQVGGVDLYVIEFQLRDLRAPHSKD